MPSCLHTHVHPRRTGVALGMPGVRTGAEREPQLAGSHQPQPGPPGLLQVTATAAAAAALAVGSKEWGLVSGTGLRQQVAPWGCRRLARPQEEKDALERRQPGSLSCWLTSCQDGQGAPRGEERPLALGQGRVGLGASERKGPRGNRRR